ALSARRKMRTCVSAFAPSNYIILAQPRNALALSPAEWAFSILPVLESRSNAWHVSDRQARRPRLRRGSTLRSCGTDVFGCGAGREAGGEPARAARRPAGARCAGNQCRPASDDIR